jgi:MFS family permease
VRDDADGGGVPSAPSQREVLRVPAFALFWSATTIRAFGGAISGTAVQVLIVTVLDATPVQISVLSAVAVLPYLFLGLVVGALMDRWRRQRALVVTTIGRALVLAVIPVLLLLGALDFWSLALVLLIQGVLTLFAQSAEQPLLPRLVPRRSLVIANARLGQSGTVATTAGPAVAGVLLSVIGAPILFAVDAVINVVAVVLQSRIEVQEARPGARAVGRHIGHEVVDGMRYTYSHRTLRPLAISVHAWFLGNSIVATVFAVFTLRELDLSAWAFGSALAVGGVGGFVGALVAPRLGSRLGAGRAILLGRSLAVLPWLMLAVLPITAASGPGVLLPLVSAAQFVYGLSMGIEDANDTGYRQSVAPDAIQGRMNSTIRTVNRVVFFAGALLTGALVTSSGYRLTLGIGAAVFAAAAAVVLVSPLRSARYEE